MTLPPPRPPQQEYPGMRQVGLGCAILIIVAVVILCVAFVVWMVRILL